MNIDTISISMIYPECRGAPYPKFNKKGVNESKFEDGLRAKYWDINIENGVGYINWISQEDCDPSKAWEDEVIRAFKENGLKAGSTIHVKFGSRYTGYTHDYELKV